MTVSMMLNWDGIATPTWVDYTDFFDVSKFTVNISLNSDNDPQKSTVVDVEAFGDAFKVIKANLIDSINRYSNFYVIRVIDSECSSVESYFKIEDKQLRWCDNGECKLQVSLVEYVPALDCIKRTLISDNANSIFYPITLGPSVLHPRFRYCDVVKPTFLYGMIVTFVNAVSAFIFSLNLVIISITGIIVWIVNLLGGSWTVPTIGFGFAEDMLGCSRGHPSPYVRTYIDNVCSICNMSISDATAPILYTLVDNIYYNLCLATAYTTKGVDMNNSSSNYLQENQPSWDLQKFLSLLKGPFNARWFILGSTIYFERKDRIGQLIWGGTPALDLSGSDYDNILGEVCYTYNGEGKPKRLVYNYGTDPSDNIGNELMRRFRGIYEDTSGNANYNETVEKTILEFGSASFVMDGKDSLYDANIDKALGGILTGSSYRGCLKTQGDTFSLAKLLIHDDSTPIDDARVWGVDYDVWGSAGADINSMIDDDANFFPISSSDCKNYNYPMSFDPDADAAGNSYGGYRNLWQFHQIDIPSPAKNSNIDIDLTLQYCCQYNSLNLYQTILLRDGVTQAEIYSIDFDKSAKREIKIKAKLK